MTISTIEKAIDEIKRGKMIIVVDDEDRENEGDLVMAADHVNPESVNFMITHGKGLLCVPMESKRMEELDIPQMVSNNTDPNGTAFGVSVDAVETGTGISAHERCKTIKTLCHPNSCPSDLRRPGHIFPLRARKGGVLARPGHTEASVDLARMAGLQPMGVICEIINEDGTMARMEHLEKFSSEHSLIIVTIKELIAYRRKRERLAHRDAEFDSPTKYGHFKGICFRDVVTGESHIALVKGEVEGCYGVLVRIHSECLTGDALGSLRCDCGEQLREAMKMLGESDKGVLVYLRQEGRGIGLHNKLKAYQLQDGGQDTYEANISLGFPPDLREYYIAASILRDLGVKSVKLLTNNPDKLSGLSTHGIEYVERVPLETGIGKDNYLYLVTKKEKFGHMLGIERSIGVKNENH